MFLAQGSNIKVMCFWHREIILKSCVFSTGILKSRDIKVMCFWHREVILKSCVFGTGKSYQSHVFLA